MERKNKTEKFALLGLFLVFGIFLMSSVSAEMGDVCDLSVTLVNQDPYPAIPGDYVDVVFQMGGIESSKCSGAVFELVPSYPFSLDEEADTKKVLEGSTWVSNYKTEWNIPYSLRVDKNALDGNATITVKYGQEETSISKDFDIKIEDSRTDFDAVIQEVSDDEVSIAIANIGEYSANSVVIRIPEQENFEATETVGQMVGDLDSGDYTLVSFSLMPSFNESEKRPLKFEIHYTDDIGERRIVDKELLLQMNSGSTDEDVRSGPRWILWISIVIIVFVLYKKRNWIMQKIKGTAGKKKLSSGSSDVPEWVKKNNHKKK